MLDISTDAAHTTSRHSPKYIFLNPIAFDTKRQPLSVLRLPKHYFDNLSQQSAHYRYIYILQRRSPNSITFELKSIDNNVQYNLNQEIIIFSCLNRFTIQLLT